MFFDRWCGLPVIKSHSDPVLRREAAVVKDLEDEGFKKCLERLFEVFMDKERSYRVQPAVGLAAPQIGIGLKVFVASIHLKNSGSCGKYRPKAYINPRVIHEEGKYADDENCLSLGRQWYSVERPELIVAEYMNLRGDLITRELTRWRARVFLHETDHLNGLTIKDRGTPLKERKTPDLVMDRYAQA